MKILVIADIHDLHWKYGSGQADVLLSCGDVSDQVIMEAASAYGLVSVFAVKGNHDINAPFTEPIIDLHLKTFTSASFSFGGLNGSWKYKPRGHFLYDQEEVNGFLSEFPNVDVFISHNSPRHIHDQDDQVHFGFEGLNSYITRVMPKLVFHGHQHVDCETLIAETRVIGVCGYRLIEI